MLSILAVFTQFWRTVPSYMTLREPKGAGLALGATILVIALTGLVPSLFLNWNELVAELAAERMPELLAAGMTSTAADSLIAVELEEMEGISQSLPVARVVERGILALVAGLAAFGIAYAVEGRKVGRLVDFASSAMLSQGAYMLIGTLLVMIVVLFKIPPSVRLNLGVFVPTGTLDPSRMHVFLFRFLSSIDLPSIASILLWGTGLAALNGRESAWGIRLCTSVFLVGVCVEHLGVLFKSAFDRDNTALVQK